MIIHSKSLVQIGNTDEVTNEAHLDNHSIFRDSINFDGLLILAEKNTNFRDLIIRNYAMAQHRLHEKKLIIQGQTDFTESSDRFEITPQSIIIHRHDLAMQFLRNFGDVLKSIEISNFFLSKPQFDEISRSVAEFCSKTLQEIHLQLIKLTLADELSSEVFRNVENVTISAYIQCNNMELHKMFPAMRRLKFDSHDFANVSLIAHHFPRLEYVSCFGSLNSENEEHIMKLLELNPQLRSLDTNYFSNVQHLRFVHDKLPNLEHLGISYFDSANINEIVQESSHIERVRFENLKEFSIALLDSDFWQHEHIPCAFDRLESLELHCYHLSDRLMEFIFENKFLKKLLVPMTSPTYQQLTKIVNELPHLDEMSVKWDREDNKGLIELMAETSQLKKIHIFLNRVDDSEAVVGIVPSKWKLINVMGNHRYNESLTFEF